MIDRGTEEEPGVGVEQRAPPREPEQPHRMLRRDRASAGAARSPARRAATTSTPTNASTPPVPAIASRKRSRSESCSVGSGPATTPEHDERADHHDRVADRRGGGDREAPARVQQARSRRLPHA